MSIQQKQTMHRVSGFLDWWNHRVKGHLLSNLEYDAVYERLTIKDNKECPTMQKN